jgi:hypothetical protein
MKVVSESISSSSSMWFFNRGLTTKMQCIYNAIFVL